MPQDAYQFASSPSLKSGESAPVLSSKTSAPEAATKTTRAVKTEPCCPDSKQPESRPASEHNTAWSVLFAKSDKNKASEQSTSTDDSVLPAALRLSLSRPAHSPAINNTAGAATGTAGTAKKKGNAEADTGAAGTTGATDAVAPDAIRAAAGTAGAVGAAVTAAYAADRNTRQPMEVMPLKSSQLLDLQAQRIELEAATGECFGLKRSSKVLHDLKHQYHQLAVSLGCMALSFICVGAVLSQALAPTVHPYLVTVDTQGNVINRGLITEDIRPELNPVLTQAQLCDFIRHVRLVSSDKKLQQQLMTRAYAMVSPDSSVFRHLERFYAVHNPLQQDGREVSVDILNVITTGDSTMQIDWEETTYDPSLNALLSKQRAQEAQLNTRSGSLKNNSLSSRSGNDNGSISSQNPVFSEATRRYRALLSFKQEPAVYQSGSDSSTKLLQLNPLGLLVTEFIVSDLT